MASHSHSPSLSLGGGGDNHSSHEHVSASSDEHMNDPIPIEMHESHVDHEAFCHLLIRTTNLKKQVAGLNENISRMSDLFNQFMHHQAMSGRGEDPAREKGHGAPPPIEATPTVHGKSGGAGTSTEDVLLADVEGADGVPYEGHGHLTSKDKVDLLKNMTPPVFKGEDRERNKDAVNTYLHKWNDLHTLRNTPDFLRAIESSLSLEGKAYKWYMSLSSQARASTWSRYQDMFRKEFMPEN